MAKFFERLDKLLVDKGLAPTRERAQALVLAGKVLVNGRVLTNAGQKVPQDSQIGLIRDPIPYFPNTENLSHEQSHPIYMQSRMQALRWSKRCK